MKLAPSILAADLADLRGELERMEAAGVDYVHCDVMDGHFVPNLTFGPPLIRCARRHTSLPFDVHLMVSDPAAYVPQLTDLDVTILSFQAETTHFAPRLAALIRDHGMRPSVALNPATPLSAIEEVLPLVDYVLLMSVDPGFAGQSFLPGTFAKIEKLVAFREEHELVFSIEVDGGVNLNNIDELAGSGVDTVVAGKAFFTAEDQRAFTDAVHRAGPNSG